MDKDYKKTIVCVLLIIVGISLFFNIIKIIRIILGIIAIGIGTYGLYTLNKSK